MSANLYDLSKKRGDIREFVRSALTDGEAQLAYSDNLKIIQQMIIKRRDEGRHTLLADSVLQQWIREEVSRNKRLLLEGFDLETLTSLYMDGYRGYGILQPFISDNRFSDVKVIKYDQIWTKGKEGWKRQPVTFSSQDEADKFIQGVFQKCSQTLNMAVPYNNCIDERQRLRINGSIGAINPFGAFMVARKQNHYQMSDADLIKKGTTNESIQAFMDVMLQIDTSFGVYGEQNSGKTTYLGSILDKIPEYRALSTFEDTPEFSLTKKNWHSHVTMPMAGEGFKPVHLEDLIQNFFRESGEWCCIGEVRGPETFDLLKAASGGNPSCLSGHAGSAELFWDRLLLLSLAKSGLREETLKRYFQLYFKVLVGMVSVTEKDAKRVQVVSLQNDEGQMTDIWKWHPRSNDWQFTPLPNWFINRAKESLPHELLRKAKVI